jgi:YNFM family putative membrane transporter
VFQSLGWSALAISVMLLACITAVTVAVVHPRKESSPPTAAGHGRQQTVEA